MTKKEIMSPQKKQIAETHQKFPCNTEIIWLETHQKFLQLPQITTR